MNEQIQGLLSNLKNELMQKFGNVDLIPNGNELKIVIPKEDLIKQIKSNLNESYRNFIDVNITDKGIEINIKLM